MYIRKEIFRSYDIRGLYPKELGEGEAELIGKALGTFALRKGLKKIVVGRDNRSSSPSLSFSFEKGLVDVGCDVSDIGVSLTPIIHFLTCTQPFDLGVIVTASHNPKEFNGFRIDYCNAEPFYGNDIQTLYQMIRSSDFTKGTGSLIKKDLFLDYKAFMKKNFDFKSNVKIVLDCGNGTSSFFAPGLFSELGCEVYGLYCESDSQYPHGIPDPENRLFTNDLSEKVLREHGDVGFAFDTDSDRFGFVDELGTPYENDKALLFFARDILPKKPGADVIYDIKSSGIVGSEIRKLGGRPVMLRTGHPYFAEALKDGAVLGAEYSGHMYFGDKYFGYDDGIYAALRVVEILVKTGKKISELMLGFPSTFHSSEIKLPCKDDEKFGVIEKVKNDPRLISAAASIIKIDGVRAELSNDAWFLIRASNTFPVISVRVEAKTKSEVFGVLEVVKSLLEDYESVDLKPLSDVRIYEA